MILKVDSFIVEVLLLFLLFVSGISFVVLLLVFLIVADKFYAAFSWTGLHRLTLIVDFESLNTFGSLFLI